MARHTTRTAARETHMSQRRQANPYGKNKKYEAYAKRISTDLDLAGLARELGAVAA